MNLNRFVNLNPSHPGPAKADGQSLVEFVLVMPILVLILIGGFSMGIGTYQAHMASDAVQFPAMEKLSLSNQTGAVNGGTLQQYMNGGNLKGSLNVGSLIDSVRMVDADQYTSIMVAEKTFTPSASFIPGFTIRVGQAINKNLLDGANNGAPVHSMTQPPLPGGTPVVPPWEGGAVATTADGTTVTPPADGTTVTPPADTTTTTPPVTP